MLHQTNGHKKENVPFYKKTTEQSAALSRLGEKQKKSLAPCINRRGSQIL